jgi:D-threonate/D-erythronate kinase
MTVRVDGRRRVHKIDSALRGNWPEEIAALARLERVLMIPSFPAVGRVCVGGVVLDHGTPVAEGPMRHDGRGAPRTSRPAELLGTWCDDVVELDPSGGAAWAAATGRVAVADASTDDDIARLVDAVEGSSVVVVGPAAVVAKCASAPGVPVSVEAPAPLPHVDRVVLVVGSRHRVAGRQMTAVRARAHPGVVLIGPPDEPADPEAVCGALAERVERERRAGDAIVVVGGDTAAAVVGDEVAEVVGSWAPGVAVW